MKAMRRNLRHFVRVAMSLLSWLGRLVLGSRPQFHGYDAEHLDPNVYYHFKNLIIPTARGTSEIDHLIVSRYGLFVFELKDRSGWIFGDEKAKTWTAIHFGKKFRFENPLHQNFGHLMALRDLLGISPGMLHAAVVFRGDFQFKTAIPHGVLCHRYASWVQSQTIALMEDSEVNRILATLEERKQVGRDARNAHVESLRARLTSTTVCPKCGGNLVARTARKGTHPGASFLGCSNYPQCKFIRNH